MKINFNQLFKSKKKQNPEEENFYTLNDNEEFDLNNDLNIEDDYNEKPKGYFQRHPSHKILLIVLAIVCVPTFIGYRFSIAKTEKQIEKEQERVNTELSEMHTKLGYYLMEGELNDKLQATAILVGHIIDTGCSSAYTQLMRAYENESLQYLQDYLRGHDCKEYYNPNVVILNKYSTYADFLLITEKKAKKYTISVYFTDNKVMSFKISEYTDKDLISGTETNNPKQKSTTVEEQNTLSNQEYETDELSDNEKMEKAWGEEQKTQQNTGEQSEDSSETPEEKAKKNGNYVVTVTNKNTIDENLNSGDTENTNTDTTESELVPSTNN